VVGKRGLPTGHAQFIEEARSRGELYIQQPCDLCSAANHESWRRLFEPIRPRWERYANRREGKLDNVAPGLPQIDERDLRSFLEAAHR